MVTRMLKEGDKAPIFCLKNAEGKEVCLSDFAGKKVVLYFYPRDNTPGCTIEAQDFSAFKDQFAKKKVVILGVSKDSCESHKKFVDKKDLTITLLSDSESKIQKLYGVWRPKKFMGREFLGTVRTTFLIGVDGVVDKVWDGVKAKGHAEEVLQSI